MKAFNYKIIGTSHVAKESKTKIQKAVEDFKPDIICIELDKQRLHSMLKKANDERKGIKQKDEKIPISMITKIGLWGYMFSIIGRHIQNKMGEKLNIMPGQDMLSAVEIAAKNKLPIVLIDQNIQITLKRLSKNFKFRDKMNFVGDFFRGLVMPKKVLKEMGFSNINLSKVPSEEVVEHAIAMVERRYPGIYKVIVHERNVFMVNKMYNILKKDPEKRILSVVGAGHKSGMEKILNQKLLKLEYIK